MLNRANFDASLVEIDSTPLRAHAVSFRKLRRWELRGLFLLYR